MTEINFYERFATLAAAESYTVKGLSAEEGIGIYNEKRLHRVLKRTFCDNENFFEVKVGRYTADVLCDGHIYEIQCASFAPLTDKIGYYLNETDNFVTVVHPLVVKRKIIRADRESGEISYVRSSPKKARLEDILPKLYYLRDFIGHARFSVIVALVEVEEYRYSEAVRYRKSGKYDNEVFPTKLVELVELREVADYVEFLPAELIGQEFSAADYQPHTRLRGRDLYSALNLLSHIGLIDKRTEGRRSVYRS